MRAILFFASFLGALGVSATLYNPATVVELIQNINDANTNGADDIIDLSKGPFVLTAADNGVNGLPVILSDNNHTLLVRNGIITRNSMDSFRFFEVDTGATLSLSLVTLLNGDSGPGPNDPGGAILVNGTLASVDGCTFMGNHALQGGVIAIIGSAGSISNSTFDSNQATAGGALSIEGTLDSLSFSAFTSQRATSAAGAIHVKVGGIITTIADTDFTNNAVTNGTGGAILVNGRVGTLRESVFTRNASITGGAIFVTDQNGTPSSPGTIDLIEGTRFVGNSAQAFGGAIAGSSTPDPARPIVIGAIDLCEFINNKGFQGGALSLVGVGLTSIDRTTFDNNRAIVSGGALFSGSGRIEKIENSTFANNQVTGQAGLGGAIFLQSEVISMVPIASSINLIDNSTFSGNQVTGNGGAISMLSEGGDDSVYIANFSNNTVANNSAQVQGGGLHLPYLRSIRTFISAIVAKNTASQGPDVSDIAGAITTEKFNFIGNNSGSHFVAGQPNDNDSFVGTASKPLDPHLAALADNGGPTKTRALLSNSKAIDNGDNPLNLVYDQRGANFARESGDQTDIGAFEVQESCEFCPDCPDDPLGPPPFISQPIPVGPPVIPVGPLPVGGIPPAAGSFGPGFPGGGSPTGGIPSAVSPMPGASSTSASGMPAATSSGSRGVSPAPSVRAPAPAKDVTNTRDSEAKTAKDSPKDEEKTDLSKGKDGDLGEDDDEEELDEKEDAEGCSSLNGRASNHTLLLVWVFLMGLTSHYRARRRASLL